MDKKQKKSAAAVIDIGSNALRMEIAQAKDGELQMLERLEYPLSLGRDTFSTGSISFQKMNKTCEIINHFLEASKSYGITKVKAIATTAVREAENKTYFVDQIKIRTGLSVTVLDDSGEKTLIFRETLRRLMGVKNYKHPGLMVYIGVGNLGVAVLDKNTIPFTQNIRLGTLRLSELLTNIDVYEEQNNIVIDDYLRAFTETFYDTLPEGEIKHFIASGRDMETIAALCHEENTVPFTSISRKKFNRLYEGLQNKSSEEIMETYGIPLENAELLQIAVSIYTMLLNATQASEIVAPMVYISDAVLYEMLFPKEAALFEKTFSENTIVSARATAARYHYDAEHASYVEKYSLKIFDKLKKLHGLSARERIYLQTAAILHDCGKYINISCHYDHSYEIIKNSEVVGLDMTEMELVAQIAKYHSTITPSAREECYQLLPQQKRLIVSKLAAILRLAEALDKGHIKKFENIDLKVKDNTLTISISTLMNTQIEEWSLSTKRLFFEEVYGLKVRLKKKKVV